MSILIRSAALGAGAVGRAELASSTTTSAGSMGSPTNFNLNNWALYPMIHATNPTGHLMIANSVDGNSAANPRFGLSTAGSSNYDVDHRWII